MNRYAYLATVKMIALVESLSRVKVIIHGQENIPQGSIIFVVNHFTRLETLLLPYHIHKLTGVPAWSLADAAFFEGPLAGFLEKVGAISTRSPDRDRLIVKSLLTGEANWVIFPEGRMVKDKEVVQSSFFGRQLSAQRQAHTGAASLALRTEFYRQRLCGLADSNPAEVKRTVGLFRIDKLASVTTKPTWIVPVNMTYYPIRSGENLLSKLADRYVENLSGRFREEMLTEGTMLLSGVDIDIRFGQPIRIAPILASSGIRADVLSRSRIDFNDEIPSLPEMRRKAAKLTRDYMAAIYSMTTVNHDHLFASLLKALPFARIDAADLKRRVFLLSRNMLTVSGGQCHSSLAIGQLALLTDDRYHKYRDFLMQALDSRLIRQEGDQLVRIAGRFNKAADIHRARIDNPLAVIANEVTPLQALHRKVLLTAWLPDFLIRNRLARLLRQEALAQFREDYQEFLIPGESKDQEVGAPVLLPGRNRDLGVLLIHGFLAAPREMIETARYLSARGYCVYLVRLKGHGTSPEDLASRRAEDWVESVDLGYALLSSVCQRVIVGGFSFGGGLALDCAARIGNLAGVFAIAPPARLRDPSSRFAPAVSFRNRLMAILHSSNGHKEFLEVSPEHPQINYSRLPISSLLEMVKFMKDLEAKLADIHVPALVVQSLNDPVVDSAGTEELYHGIGSRQKNLISFDLGRHGILLGEGSGKVHEALGEFVDGVR